MSLVAELVNREGVVAAGEYSYRGDRFSFKGGLSEELARRASILCRANTLAAAMQGHMLQGLWGDRYPLEPVHGWVLKGPGHSICVVANVFCLVDNARGSTGEIVSLMRRELADAATHLV
jgi:roadblock/LC7 domain-containing protein